jgi:hypothetical protein
MSAPDRNLTPLGFALQRIEKLEAAMLTLYDRQERLEQQLAFEIRQRRAFEEIAIALSRLQRRIDDLDAGATRKTAP